MNLGKTSMGHMFKKSNKIGKKDNVGVDNKYTSLLKKKLLIFFFKRLISQHNARCFKTIKNKSL